MKRRKMNRNGRNGGGREKGEKRERSRKAGREGGGRGKERRWRGEREVKKIRGMGEGGVGEKGETGRREDERGRGEEWRERKSGEGRKQGQKKKKKKQKKVFSVYFKKSVYSQLCFEMFKPRAHLHESQPALLNPFSKDVSRAIKSNLKKTTGLGSESKEG